MTRSGEKVALATRMDEMVTKLTALSTQMSTTADIPTEDQMRKALQSNNHELVNLMLLTMVVRVLEAVELRERAT